MPPPRNREHQWTHFELHTMLCLIARGVHLEQRPEKRTDAPSKARRNADETFYTALNTALHGKDYTKDIHKKEVTRMLDQMLDERKGVIGKGGLVERQLIGRITRTMTATWNRTPAINFDGSLSEWEQGRKEKVLSEYALLRARGPAPVEAADADAAMADVGAVEEAASWSYAAKAFRPQSDDTEVHPSRQENLSSGKSRAVDNPAITKKKISLHYFAVQPPSKALGKYHMEPLTTVPARDEHARNETTSPKQKRAGHRTRVVSSENAHSGSGDDDAPPAYANDRLAGARDGRRDPRVANFADDGMVPDRRKSDRDFAMGDYYSEEE